MISQLGDGSCDVECLSADCNYDERDCECATVLTERAGYRSDGAAFGADYANDQRLCWLIRPKYGSIGWRSAQLRAYVRQKLAVHRQIVNKEEAEGLEILVEADSALVAVMAWPSD